jgi:Xaa-Pro aminopeptidase
MSDYAKRRRELMKMIGAEGIVIIPSANEIIRNNDARFPFRQNSDFYYLTGFDEPEAVAVLAPKRKGGEFILFNRVRDRDHEIWDGPRAGQQGAKKIYGADEAYPIEKLPEMLSELLVGRHAVHYPLGENMAFDRMLIKSVNAMRTKIRNGTQSPVELIDVLPTLHEMRLIKSPAEILLMQKAVDITADGHLRAMQACRPDMFEYELEAELMYEFIRQGALSPAYTSIVGSGRNSCILHYISNNKKIANGDMVLIDAGAEYQNYAADITRTFPANGKFSAEQADIYQLVLEAQLAAIKTIKPGTSWPAAQQAIVKVITQGLIDLRILKGRLSDLVEKQSYLSFYMHKSGHWLGLDVHDVGRYRIGEKWRSLQPGMALTVEPGIYISADIPNVHKRWHNIGVRIEDDVLVTKKGCDVLSKDIPKKIADIEAIMAW